MNVTLNTPESMVLVWLEHFICRGWSKWWWCKYSFTTISKTLYTATDEENGGVAKDRWSRLEQKFGENILAVRLERQYTKEEIIAMYLNNFDFLYNAVGIASASQVYFNTTPDKLKMEEAAMLVGMCKNPGMFNFKISIS